MTSQERAGNGRPKHFLDISEFARSDLRDLIDRALDLKARRRAVHETAPFAGRTLAMIFEQPSTRTRLSFDLAMRQLGGETIVMTGKEMQLGRGESIPDTARVLSRFVDAITIRILDHNQLLELAENASVPVINALTHESHPCQIMSDVLTFEEHKGVITGRSVAWVGPYNNVLWSWMQAAARFGFEIRIAAPESLGVPGDRLQWMRDNGAEFSVTENAAVAVRGVDCVVTDCWISMGDDDAESRHNLLLPYQVNEALMNEAPDAIFMHCLPAHRGEEVTDAVMDGPQSVVFDEAENRLHAQKGILDWCLG